MGQYVEEVRFEVFAMWKHLPPSFHFQRLLITSIVFLNSGKFSTIRFPPRQNVSPRVVRDKRKLSLQNSFLISLTGKPTSSIQHATCRKREISPWESARSHLAICYFSKSFLSLSFFTVPYYSGVWVGPPILFFFEVSIVGFQVGENVRPNKWHTYLSPLSASCVDFFFVTAWKPEEFLGDVEVRTGWPYGEVQFCK